MHWRFFLSKTGYVIRMEAFNQEKDEVRIHAQLSTLPFLNPLQTKNP